MAIIFADESEITSRFKPKKSESSKRNKVNKDSIIEIKFQKSIIHWSNLIDTMLSKIDNSIAWRFINLTPEITTDIKSVVYYKDFCDINDYLVLRRDKEICDDAELGRLAMLSVAIQREIEKTFN